MISGLENARVPAMMFPARIVLALGSQAVEGLTLAEDEVGYVRKIEGADWRTLSSRSPARSKVRTSMPIGVPPREKGREMAEAAA